MNCTLLTTWVMCVSAGEWSRACPPTMELCARDTWCPAFEVLLMDAQGSHLCIPIPLSNMSLNCLKSTTVITGLFLKSSTLLTRAHLSSQDNWHPEYTCGMARFPHQDRSIASTQSQSWQCKGLLVSMSRFSLQSPWRPVLSILFELFTLYIPTRISEPGNELYMGCQDRNLICG